MLQSWMAMVVSHHADPRCSNRTGHCQYRRMIVFSGTATITSRGVTVFIKGEFFSQNGGRFPERVPRFRVQTLWLRFRWTSRAGGSATGAHTGCTIRTSSMNHPAPPSAPGASTGKCTKVAAQMSHPHGSVALVSWNGGSPVSRINFMIALRSTYGSAMNHDGVYGFDTFLKNVISQGLVLKAKQSGKG